MNREVGTQVSKSGESRDIGRVDRYALRNVEIRPQAASPSMVHKY